MVSRASLEGRGQLVALLDVKLEPVVQASDLAVFLLAAEYVLKARRVIVALA